MAIGVVIPGTVFLAVLRHSEGLTALSGGIGVSIMALVVWAAGISSRRRLAFSGRTLRLYSGAAVKREIDLSQAQVRIEPGKIE